MPDHVCLNSTFPTTLGMARVVDIWLAHSEEGWETWITVQYRGSVERYSALRFLELVEETP